MQDIINQLIQEAQNFTWVDWGATIAALIYVFLAAREHILCWVFGIIGCSLWAYASYAYYDLWLDALLQVFYVVISFWGIYQWKFGSASKAELTITSMSTQEHGKALLLGVFLSLIFGYFFDKYTPAAATYLDAFTTVFSVITTFLVIFKKLENWLYWIVIDVAYAYLYAQQGAYLFMILMGIYLIIAVQGYFTWKAKMDLKGS